MKLKQTTQYASVGGVDGITINLTVFKRDDETEYGFAKRFMGEIDEAVKRSKR